MRRFTDDFRLDLRFAFRSLGKRRGVTALVVGTLAVGIAVVTATFSLLNSALWRPLPYPLAGETVAIIASPNDWPGNLTQETVEALRHDTHSFARVSAFYDAGMRLDLHNRVESVVGTAVDTGFSKTLGVAPERGRVPTPREIADGKPYVVISHRLWHAHLADDPGVIGRSLELDHTLFTVVGVLPPRINYGVRGGTDAWIPLPVAADTGRYFFAFAWLRPGVSLAQARAEVSTTSDQIASPQ